MFTVKCFVDDDPNMRSVFSCRHYRVKPGQDGHYIIHMDDQDCTVLSSSDKRDFDSIFIENRYGKTVDHVRWGVDKDNV